MITRERIGLRVVCPARAIVAAIAIVAAWSLAGCGGGGSTTTAVLIGTHRITGATIERSMYAQAKSSAALAGRATARTTPDPPDYADCIAYLKLHEPRPLGAQTDSTSAQLKQRCELEYEKEKLKALYFWIPYEWVAEEAVELSIPANEQEVAKQLALFESGFASKAALRRYLELTREPRSTLEARMRLALWTAHIQEALKARLHALPLAQRQAKLKQFGEAFEAKWKARTDCKRGYVVPLCRQYRPPSSPPTLVPPSVPLTNLSP